MKVPETVPDFLALACNSGLIDDMRLDAAFDDRDELGPDPRTCAVALVKRGLLTSYQAKMLLAGKSRGFLIGSYQIQSPIGQGGMGIVYLAKHTSLGRPVALKVLPNEKAKDQLALERFLREARAAAALDHPNIVRLFDVGQGAGVHFLVMEFVEGTNLQDMLQKTGPLHSAQAAHYVAQAATALHHAHQKGIIHRDVKPGNLMVTKDGTIKLLDLGLARSFGAEDELTGLIAEKTEITGTPDFISPEQMLGEGVDERSDVYSLGATLCALLTGKPPYSGTTTQKLAQHQMKDPAELRKKLRGKAPDALCDVVIRAMAKKKTERYQTAEEMADALTPWLPAPTTGNIVQDPPVADGGTLTTGARSGSGSRRPGSTTRLRFQDQVELVKRHRYAFGGGAAVLVVIAAAVIALSGGDPPAARATTNPQGSQAPVAPPAYPVAAADKFAPLRLKDVATASAKGPLFYGQQNECFEFDAWGVQTIRGVPFDVPDPRDESSNIINLYGPLAERASQKPTTVRLPVGRAVKTFHFLGGVSGWGWPWDRQSNTAAPDNPRGLTAVIVRIHYADGSTEEHEWKNGEHLADYIRRHDVPGSEFLFLTRNGAQVRYLKVNPLRPDSITALEFEKGPEDKSSPLVLAVTAEQ